MLKKYKYRVWGGGGVSGEVGGGGEGGVLVTYYMLLEYCMMMVLDLKTLPITHLQDINIDILN